jgi:hypothetical protein
LSFGWFPLEAEAYDAAESTRCGAPVYPKFGLGKALDL